MVALPIWPINHKIDNMDEVLVAKLGKSDNKCSDASLGLRRLHYNSFSVNRFFVNVCFVFKYISERLLRQCYKFCPHLNFAKLQDQMRQAFSDEDV